jgi:hypothetical protein
MRYIQSFYDAERMNKLWKREQLVALLVTFLNSNRIKIKT